MAEGYTEEDVRWLAERINTYVVFTASDGCLSAAQRTRKEVAAQALAALAGAGRLLPADGSQIAAELRQEHAALQAGHSAACECPPCAWNRGAEHVLRALGVPVPEERLEDRDADTH